jgi:hypothetical protein
MNKNYHLWKDNLGLTFRDRAEKPTVRQTGTARKLAFLLIIALFSVTANAQVTTNGGSGLAATYLTLKDAIDALNVATINSPVNITLTGNETAPAGGFAITATGTAANTIIIKGVTSTITAPTPQASGVLTDAVFKIIGGDYITIEGFTMTENSANTINTVASGNNMTEWGVALLNAAVDNGCQNVTIKGNTIDLDRTYLNTFGIYCNTNHTALDPLVAVAATTVAGNDSGLTIIGNAITDVNNGIVVIGSSNSGIENDGLTIGGSLANGNTITNYGTATGFSSFVNLNTTLQGVFMRYVKNYDVSFNTVSSTETGPTSGTIRGIYNQAATTVTALTGTIVNSISNNTISVKSAVNTAGSGAIGGIFVETFASNTTTTLTINANILNGLYHTITPTTGGNISVISNNSFAKSVIITNNIISNIENLVVTPATTILGISNNPAITPVIPDSTLDITGNSFSNILNSPAVTAAIVSLISSATTAAKITNINNNTFNNLTVNSSAAFTLITSNVTMLAGGSQTVNGNQIVTAFNKTGGAGPLP